MCRSKGQQEIDMAEDENHYDIIGDIVLDIIESEWSGAEKLWLAMHLRAHHQAASKLVLDKRFMWDDGRPGEPYRLDADAEADILALRDEIAKKWRAIAREAIGNARLAGARLSRQYFELTKLYVLGVISVDEMIERGKKMWGREG
jgi:hypothetical protein